MKYIRTKNGIYEVVDFDNECIIPSPIVKMDGRLTHISDYKNCQQADTIDELCDRYVGISNNKPMIIKYEFGEYYDEYNDSYTKEELLVYDVIYGAIWTDIGLKYVAKLNEDGELVLI